MKITTFISGHFLAITAKVSPPTTPAPIDANLPEIGSLSIKTPNIAGAKKETNIIIN